MAERIVCAIYSGPQDGVIGLWFLQDVNEIMGMFRFGLGDVTEKFYV